MLKLSPDLGAAHILQPSSDKGEIVPMLNTAISNLDAGLQNTAHAFFTMAQQHLPMTLGFGLVFTFLTAMLWTAIAEGRAVDARIEAARSTTIVNLQHNASLPSSGLTSSL